MRYIDLERQFELVKSEKLKRVRPSNYVDIMGKSVSIPVKYLDASAVMVFFPISKTKAEDLVGENRLKPISILRNRSVVGITIFEYRKCDIGPFREFTISIPVLLDSKIRPPILPLLFDSSFKNLGFQVVVLGANNDIAREHIKRIFSYPIYDKNININIKEDNNFLLASLEDDGKEIISIRKKIPCNYKLMKKKFNTYYTDNNKIFRVKLDTTLIAASLAARDNLDFSIGDHEISKLLKDLEISDQQLQGIYYKKALEIAGQPEEI